MDGTPRVPGLDHDAQLAQLQQSLAGMAKVRVSDCLDARVRIRNVIVVQPSAAGRAAGGRPKYDVARPGELGGRAVIVSGGEDGTCPHLGTRGAARP